MSLYVQKAEKIREKAENLTLPRDTVSEPAMKAADKVIVLKDQAKKDKIAIDTAKGKAMNATDVAKKARTKIEEVLRKLLELLKEIDNLDSVNVTKLTELEGKLKDEINGARAIDVSLNGLQETQTIIRERIKEYTVDLDRLKKEMAKVDSVLAAMPRICKKRLSKIESTG